MEHLHKFHLDLCIPRYSNSPQVSYLGWILEEDGTLTWRDHISQNIVIRRLLFGHSVHQEFIFVLCNFQLCSFINIGISRMYQNLAVFLFRVFLPRGQTRVWLPRVSPNQKYWSRSLNFNFDEERYPMLGSIKNSSSTRSPNFPHEKLKMFGIKFWFDRKTHPSMES